MDTTRLIESLSPNERKILPYLEESIEDICEKSELDNTSVLRALEYLQNKKIIELKFEKKKIVEIGINGSLYMSKGLPERRLLHLLVKKHIMILYTLLFVSFKRSIFSECIFSIFSRISATFSVFNGYNFKNPKRINVKRRRNPIKPILIPMFIVGGSGKSGS